ncbi:MAG TPA: hypothetical protein VGV69_05855 [Solirubrobacterales bacterium]|nr:hypothetical protein [Solirubrobacterales bacterium]
MQLRLPARVRNASATSSRAAPSTPRERTSISAPWRGWKCVPASQERW